MACAAILIAVVMGQVDVEFWKSLPFNLTLTQSWIPLWRFYYSLNEPTWFLSALMFSYAIFPWAARQLLRHKKAFVILLLLAFAAVTCLNALWPDIHEGWLN